MPLPKEIVTSSLSTPQGEAAYCIVEKIVDNGFEAWWVGGCVRDMALESIPSDIDIATSALPEEIEKLCKVSDSSGKPYGSMHIIEKGRIFHITTFREDDSASDGRHPEAVVFGSRERDAARRDFTINALYYHPISRELYDPYGGKDDLKERLVRFIGDPGVRIKHDALRMLRALRLRAAIDGQYHPETFRALLENAPLIETLSGYRILEELEKLLLGKNPDKALEDLWETGILKYSIPELYACKGIPQPADYHHEGDVWEHTMKCVRSFTSEHEIDVRIAALFHDAGKATTFSLKERIRFDQHASVSGDIVTKVLDRLQCPGKRRDKIDWLVRHHMMMASFASMNDERKAHWYYHPWFSELLQLMWIDIAGTDPSNFDFFDSIIGDYHSFLDSHPRPPKQLLSGDEIMMLLGIPAGEKIGNILKELHEKQIKGEITTKKEARAFLSSIQKSS